MVTHMVECSEALDVRFLSKRGGWKAREKIVERPDRARVIPASSCIESGLQQSILLGEGAWIDR